MDESAPIRAIVIGVSVLIAVATISAVLMYYNTAKQMATNIGTGQDFAANYEQGIKDILLNSQSNVTGGSTITGTDVKNLLNYFYQDETVEIKVSNIAKVDYNMGNMAYNDASKEYNEYDKINLDKTNFAKVENKILSGQKFTLTRGDEDNKMVLTIIGK